MTLPHSAPIDQSSQQGVPVERVVECNDRRLHLLDWGTSGCPPVLLLREPGDNLGDGHRDAPAWRDTLHVVGLHVVAPGVVATPAVAPNRPGLGNQERPQPAAIDRDTLASYSADALQAADALGWGRFSVVGQSVGGMLGIYLAAEHPERIERLVISNAEPLDLWLRLQNIRCPTLLVRGAESDNLRQEIAERMIQEIVDSRLVVVPAAGHLPGADSPDAYQEAVRDFLFGKEPAGAIRSEHDIG